MSKIYDLEERTAKFAEEEATKNKEKTALTLRY